MKSVQSRRKQLLILILMTGLLSATWSSGYAEHGPDHILVTTTEDSTSSDDLCSLREAVISANKDNDSTGDCASGNGADVIELVAGMNYILTKDDNGNENSSSSGDLDIDSDLTILGNGATITGEAGFRNRIIHVLSGTVVIKDVTISGGGPKRDGGGILNEASLTLASSVVSGNTTNGSGGGINNVGTELFLSNVSIIGNSSNGDGGGIFNGSDLEVSLSTFASNTAGGNGGAISNEGILTAANVTVSGNSSADSGGGLHNAGTLSTISNGTVTGNYSDSDGKQGGDGGGIFLGAGDLTIYNTIVAGNYRDRSLTQPSDCSGAVLSGGHNLIQSDCGVGNGDTDITGEDPILGPLADNGGATQTHTLLEGSPAIDKGNQEFAPGSGRPACELTDQRGSGRPALAACDIGAVEVDPPTSPELIRAFKITGGSIVDGLKTDTPDSEFTLSVYAGLSCEEAFASENLVETIPGVTVDSDGYFHVTLSKEIPDGLFVVATFAGDSGDESAPSLCIVSGPGNDSWPKALRLNFSGGSASIPQYIEMEGQSRWFKFQVQPDSQITITLNDLPVNYDLTLYTDIQEAFNSLILGDGQDEQLDLLRLGAEYAPNAFSPNAFSPDALSPNAFSPNAFSPNAFSPNAFSPNAFSPNAFSPNAFSPNAFSPDALSPDAFSPNAFSPNAFSPNDFSPNAFSPNAFSPNAFSSAQTRSLLGVSAFDGTASEGLRLNTWNSTGDFYIRIRGRNGAFSLDNPFLLEVSIAPGGCGAVSVPSSGTIINGEANGYKTLILVDWGRLGFDQGLDDKVSELLNRLNVLNLPGVLVDVGTDGRVSLANEQADDHADCPLAKNIVAEEIRDIIERYRDLNSIEYVVILGNDDVIPFFRYPDQALLGNEDNYYPPVLDLTSSQASLRLGYVLSQDAYGASVDVRIKDHALPIAEIPVGRLVEDPSDMVSVIDAFLFEADGIVSPSSSLVTGYDFLEDAANDIQSQFVAGLTGASGVVNDTLITPNHISPEGPIIPGDPEPWTSDDLANSLFGRPHDLIFLAGHFSANSALAADYTTQLLTTDLTASSTDFRNSIVFSAGCHSGYNIVNEHGIPVITFEPDWAQAFAQKGATLIAGTGYQYGDTDFIEYSERLYAEFAQQLRTGGGPVSVGEALVRSKQIYLAGTPQLRPIHEKSYLEVTIFGLPMLKVDMPTKLPNTGVGSIVSTTFDYLTNPGAFLGLEYADISLNPNLVGPIQVTVKDPKTGFTDTAEYLKGSNGVLANPSEPVLPLEVRNVSLADTVLRGVGFKGGSYTEDPDVLPLTAAPATEIRGVHTPFIADAYYPVRPWGVNYFGALADPDLDGPIYLSVTPAQVRSTDPGSKTVTVRQYSAMSFRLYYSDYVTPSGNSVPADADAPTIVEVTSEVIDGVAYFRVRVNGNPAAGIQEVWITYTSGIGSFYGSWQSLNLMQNPSDSTLWEGSLDLDEIPRLDVRFMVQAVNGVGMVSGAANQGVYYTPGVSGEPIQPTSLVFTTAPQGGPYSTDPTFRAKLEDISGDLPSPMPDKLVTFGLGPVVRQAFTNASGVATVKLPILASPGSYDVRAVYSGDDTFIASFADQGFVVSRQGTSMTLNPNPFEPPGTVTATLEDASMVPLSEKTVVFVLDLDGVPLHAQAVITDYAGRASTDLEGINLASGSYTLTAYFGGTITLPGTSNTVRLADSRYGNSFASTNVLMNNPPDCTTVVANPAFLWPPDGKMMTVTLSGGSDPDGHNITIGIFAVYQDEPLTKKFDAQFTVGSDTVRLRNERDGVGDGRVFHIFATVTDELGASCGSASPLEGPAIVRVPVNHDNSDIDSIDGGPQENSAP